MKMCSTGSHVWTVSWGRWCCWEVNELLELWTSLKEERDGGGALSEFTHLPHFQVTLFLYVELKCDLFPLLLPACLSRWTASPLQLFLTPLLIKEFYRSSRRVVDTQPLRVTRPGHEQLHGLPHHKNNHERPGRPLSLYLLKIAYTLLGYITQVWEKKMTSCSNFIKSHRTYKRCVRFNKSLLGSHRGHELGSYNLRR